MMLINRQNEAPACATDYSTDFCHIAITFHSFSFRGKANARFDYNGWQQLQNKIAALPSSAPSETNMFLEDAR